MNGLKAVRRQCNMTIQEVADKLNVSKHGKRVLRLSLIPERNSYHSSLAYLKMFWISIWKKFLQCHLWLLIAIWQLKV